MTKPGTLYVSCGVPGSGKSTFLKEMKGDNEVIISRDEIRFSLLKPGDEYFSKEKTVYSTFVNNISTAIKNGYNVYADATHLNQKSRYKLMHALKTRGCKPLYTAAIYFDVPIDICKERNNKRFGTKAYVPEEQLLQMYGAFVPPHTYEGFTYVYRVDEDGYVDLEENGE